MPPSRRLIRATVRDPRTGLAVDDGLTVFFPAPASLTGEDMAELHLHGGRAVIAATMDALRALEGFRLAERGEFSRRAFEAGKLDLTAAEGLADLLAAETEMQRRQALRQAGGVMSAVYEGWRQRLINGRALIEAELDFAEGEDLPASAAAGAWREIDAVRSEIAAVLQDGRRGERLRDGIDIVILGPPNAGKSSLLNALAQREAAIVSPEPGTTRDLIEVHMDLGGYPVTLIDTAGLRQSGDAVEREGVRRAEARAAAADIALVLSEAGGARLALTLPREISVLQVATKVDLLDSEPERRAAMGPADHAISVVTAAGIERLLDAVSSLIGERYGSGELPVITRHRHRDALSDCLDALNRARMPSLALEVVAEELRTASDALARVTGRIDVEDWLDVIFREFCIGK